MISCTSTGSRLWFWTFLNHHEVSIRVYEEYNVSIYPSVLASTVKTKGPLALFPHPTEVKSCTKTMAQRGSTPIIGCLPQLATWPRYRSFITLHESTHSDLQIGNITLAKWQVSKWWCDGHPQASCDLAPWRNEMWRWGVDPVTDAAEMWLSCLSVERLHVLTNLNGSFLMHHFEKTCSIASLRQCCLGSSLHYSSVVRWKTRSCEYRVPPLLILVAYFLLPWTLGICGNPWDHSHHWIVCWSFCCSMSWQNIALDFNFAGQNWVLQGFLSS